MKARYLIILTAVVLALVIASPVSAFYSLSVSGFKDPAVSSRFQSPFKDISQQDRQAVFSALKENVIITGPTQGSVRASSSSMHMDPNSVVRFSERVSVDGEIYSFHYSASFKS